MKVRGARPRGRQRPAPAAGTMMRRLLGWMVGSTVALALLGVSLVAAFLLPRRDEPQAPTPSGEQQDQAPVVMH